MAFAHAVAGGARRVRASWRAAVVLGGLLLLLATPAYAQGWMLTWSAPSVCPEGRYVEQRVASLLAQEGFAGDGLRARARVAKRGGRFVLELSLEGGGHAAQRTLTAARCRSLADACAWLIAVALDPSLAGHAASREQEEPVARGHALGDSRTPQTGEGLREAAPAQQRAPAPPTNSADGVTKGAPAAAAGPEASADRREGPTKASEDDAPRSYVSPARRLSFRTRLRDRPRWWRLGAFAGAWDAGLPAPHASIGARGGYGMGLLLLELRVAAHLARERSLREDASVRFATQELGGALCAQWGARLRGGPCAAIALLRSTGDVRGTTQPRRDALLWGSAGVTVQLGYNARDRVELLAELGVSVPASARPRFTIAGIGEVAEASPLTVYARLGLGYRAADRARPSSR